MKTFRERLLAIIDEHGEGKKLFALKIGISPAKLSTYIKEEKASSPSIEIVNQIAQNLPQFNIVWLLTGQGEMYNSGFAPPKKSEGSGEVSEEVQAIINSMQTRMDNLESSVRWLMNQMNGSKQDIPFEVGKAKANSSNRTKVPLALYQ